MEAGTVRIHLKRFEGRLIEREAALQTPRKEIDVAENLDIEMKDIKPRMKKHGKKVALKKHV